MATQMRDMTQSADQHWSDRIDGTPAIDAVCRLAGAKSAEVLAYDRFTGTLHPLAASSNGGPGPAAGALVEATLTHADGIPGDPRARWIAADDGDGDTLFLMKLPDREARACFVVLAFAEASAVVRARVTKLAPDLTTLVRFHVDVESRFRELEEVGAVATAALDHGECAVIAIRADRSMIFRNEAAAACLRQGSGLHLRGGRIEAADGKRFEAELHHILDAVAERPDERPPATVMLLKRKGGERPMAIVIAPVGPMAPAEMAQTGAAAILYVVDPTQGALRGLDALCQLHGLSGVESRLLINLASGLTLADAAGEMRIKLETARTYLKQIFAKTGTHRQTDLVAMMLRYLRALRGNFDFRPA